MSVSYMYCASGAYRRICPNVTEAKIDQSIWSSIPHYEIVQLFFFKINLKPC